MPVTFVKWYDRADLMTNPDFLYVFGDNILRVGMGGQAYACRGEPNAVGIPTKWAPHSGPGAFFDDEDFARIVSVIEADFNKIIRHLDNGGTVVFPADGLGTGLAELPQRAPKIHEFISGRVQTLCEAYGVA